MNILCLFPQYFAIELLEYGAIQKFLSTADKIIDSATKGRNRLFFLAENDTARRLKADVPKARFAKITQEADLDLVELSDGLKDCYYGADIKPALDLSVPTEASFSSMEEFAKYYESYIQKVMPEVFKKFDVVVNFTLAKYSRFKVKQKPDSIIYCEYNMQTSDFKVYIGGSENESISKEWKERGLPYEA